MACRASRVGEEKPCPLFAGGAENTGGGGGECRNLQAPWILRARDMGEVYGGNGSTGRWGGSSACRGGARARRRDSLALPQKRWHSALPQTQVQRNSLPGRRSPFHRGFREQYPTFREDLIIVAKDRE